MVRNDHKHDDDNPNTKSSGRDCCAGLPLLETGQKAAIMAGGELGGTRAQSSPGLKSPRNVIRQGCLRYVLAERKICFYSRHICVVDACCLGQPAFALCTFRRQQMASRGTRPQDLASGSDLEAFRHCFARFAACNRLRHTAGKLIGPRAMTNGLLYGVCVRHRNGPLARASQTPYNFRDAIFRT
jgi:hypothetical protein